MELVRAIVIGCTRPGNSTVFRAGTMMRASDGSGRTAPASRPDVSSAGGVFSASATEASRLLQGDRETAAHELAADTAVAARRQGNAPVEPPLRQLEAMAGCGPQLRRPC